MKKVVYLEPVVNSGSLSSFTVFDSEGVFLYHQFSHPDEVSYCLGSPEKFTYVCFDAFRSLPVCGASVSFIWSVKILYELLGFRFNNIIDLARLVLGVGQVRKYIDFSDQVKAHLRSYRQADIDVSSFQAIRLLPEDLLRDLYMERASLTKILYCRLEDQEKDFYEKFYKSVVTLHHISSTPLNIDLTAIASDLGHAANTVRSVVKNDQTYLKFKAVGAKTGRLGFCKGSLNIYNLPKPLRKCIVASPGCEVVEVDFKSFQPRIAVFSTDSESFKDEFRRVSDIYSIFPGDREENKILFLAWMYAKTRSTDSIFEKAAWPIWKLREDLAKKCRDDGVLITRWGRRLYVKDDPEHIIFQNFITATEVDCVLQLMNGLVRNNIKVLFSYHDAIICEVAEGDTDTLKEVKCFCENFLFSVFKAKFPVEIKVGKSFGTMNAVQIL